MAEKTFCTFLFLRRLFTKARSFCSLVVLSLCVPPLMASGTALDSPAGSEGWRLNCKPQVGSTEQFCVVEQKLKASDDSGRIVLGVMVAYMKEHPLPHIIFRFSPNANTDKGAAVKIDDHQSVNVPISSCDKHVCEVRSFIPEGLLLQMRNGNLMQFAFFIDNQQLTYPISLQDFDNTYKALKSPV